MARKLIALHRTREVVVDAEDWRQYRLSVFDQNLVISATLRELRLVLGIAQYEIADRLGVSPGTVGNWESGRSHMDELWVSKYKALLKKLSASSAA